ncbi:MAG: carboxypeptidase regulatory-like domain-containing protein [Calditrichaeota bacterium]|nr:MAG: carboxypeptidase regulatory-like domain-containing protein [Calditrichota bacterium]
MIRKLIFVHLFCAVGTVILNCHNSTEPGEAIGTVQGRIKSINDRTINTAFILLNDSLLTTATDGSYSVTSLKRGKYSLICSAPSFCDTAAIVQINGGQTTHHDFTLRKQTQSARLYGEFQDGFLWRQAMQQEPAKETWSEKQLFEGVTGATLQSMTLEYQLPQRSITLGDSTIAIADDFGQFWVSLPCGTFPFFAHCEGYVDAAAILRIQPDQRNYAIFVLERAAAESQKKPIAFDAKGSNLTPWQQLLIVRE